MIQSASARGHLPLTLQRRHIEQVSKVDQRAIHRSQTEDYSAAALDKAVGELRAALEAEATAVKSESDWKTLPRSLDGPQERGR